MKAYKNAFLLSSPSIIIFFFFFLYVIPVQKLHISKKKIPILFALCLTEQLRSLSCCFSWSVSHCGSSSVCASDHCVIEITREERTSLSSESFFIYSICICYECRYFVNEIIKCCALVCWDQGLFGNAVCAGSQGWVTPEDRERERERGRERQTNEKEKEVKCGWDPEGWYALMPLGWTSPQAALITV